MPTRPTQRAVPKVMTGSQFDRVLVTFSSLSLIVVGALATIMALAAGQAILAPITLAIIVGLMFGPLVDRMEKRGIPAALSAGIAVLILVGVLALAAYLFAVPLSEWIKRGPELWDKLRTQLAVFKGPLDSLSSIQDQIKSVIGGGTALSVQVQDGGPVTSAALAVPSILADCLLFIAALYFFLATRDHIRISVLSLCFSRKMRWRAAHIFRDVEQKVSRFLLSATLINAGVGVATATAMWALGMPSPLLWGALAMVMNFIPYVGQAVMFVVLFAVGLSSHPDLLGMILPVVIYAGINLTADQIVFPHLVGRALTLNPFVIFVSIAFWLWLWGPMGGFIAVPVLLILQSIILHIFPTTQNLVSIVRRRVEAKTNADMAEAEAAAPTTPPAPAPAAPPKPRRTRKPSAAASP